MSRDIREFSEFGRRVLEGERANFEREVLGRTVIIYDFTELVSDYQPKGGDPDNPKMYVVIQFSYVDNPDVLYTTATGSDVIIRQLKDVKPHLPLKATPTRPEGKRYYQLT